MKKIEVILGDKVAEWIASSAAVYELTSADVIRTIINNAYGNAMNELNMRPRLNMSVQPLIQQASGQDLDKIGLLWQANQGTLTCKSCTMRLTPEDVERNECSHCHNKIHGDQP
jgi:hypothetical protein